ncbi:MAG: DUF4190 domain-containing protein [Sedimentisphaerales bacterium]|nr:DUF4190 domain-containing protein [Sedimentisphaerales bacterium]
MYCQKCGSQNPDGSTRCFSCGYELVQVSYSATATKTSGLAIATLILGILAPLTIVTALPAVICGILALVNISGSRGRLKGVGMAVAGILLPILIVPMMMLIAILLPALSQARNVAQREVCRIKLSSLSIAMMVYANDYEDNVPTAEKWCDLLMKEMDVPEKSFHCSTTPQGTCSYALNSNILVLEGQADPHLVLLFESQPGWNQSGGPELLNTQNHDGKGCNVAFADGHVEFVRTSELPTLKWTYDDK